MHGKVILVTGASGALGKVVAEAALARGARVAGVDYAKSQIAETPDRMELGGVDLSDSAQAKQAVDAVAAHFGRLDVLINVADHPVSWNHRRQISSAAATLARAALRHECRN